VITINLTSNIAEVKAKLRSDLQRQVPFAASRAINELAFDAREMIKNEMDNYYDGGAVRYTKNAIYSTKSNKRKLIAKVYVGGNDDHRIKYVLNTIYGGTATPRKKALTEPIMGRVRLTGVGRNIPKGAIGRLKNKKNHFITEPGSKIKQGLYRRVKRGKQVKLEMLVSFDPSKQHKITFPAPKLAEAYVKKNFNKIFGKYLAQAIASRKPTPTI
jgi:hypothetical protein